MRKLLPLFIAIILLNSTFQIANAQWYSNGPYAGAVQCLTVSDTNIFAGTVYEGIYLSTDSGSKWTEVSNGLTDTSVYSLAVSGSAVFAGTYAGGVFRTTSNGAYWVSLDTGLVGGSSIVYALAATGAGIFAGTNTGAFISTDTGNNWLPVDTTLDAPDVTSFAISGGNIFAGTSENGVYLSTNNGKHWATVNNGLTDVLVLSLAVDSGVGLYAGTDNGGVFFTANNGGSWVSLDSNLYGNAVLINALAVSGTNVFAGTDNGVFLYTTGTGYWQPVGLQGIEVLTMAMTDSLLFAGADTGGVWIQPLAQLISTGIPSAPEPVQPDVKIYPNPNPDGDWQLTVDNELLGSNLEVFDEQGRLVYQSQIRNLQSEITAGTLASGVYYLRISNAAGSVVRKLVKM